MNEEVNVNIGSEDSPGLNRKIMAGTNNTAIPGKVEDSCNAPEKDDPWALPELQDHGVKWSDLTATAKVSRICINTLKAAVLLLLLYLFICSLDFLGSAFSLLGGKEAGRVLSDSSLLENPVVGLMIGVLATVLVQSSSTSTSIVITMVGSDLIQVSKAIPIIMGANIGTSVTNTIVSLTQIADRNQFRRAFAAATVHDMFNWLTVIVLLPLEAATGYLEKLTAAIMDSTNWKQNEGVNKEFLTLVTKPFTKLIIRLDKRIIHDIAVNGSEAESYNKSLILKCCKYPDCKCGFLLEQTGLSDSMVGLVLLVISLVLLTTCLVLLVKLLHSMLKGRIAVSIRKIVNVEPRFPLNLFVGYAAMFVGVGMTILVQSSSVFTSALTPLAGVGVLSIDRMYPLTLGSNIGTTTTGIFAALAASGSKKLHNTLQIAFCHLFFNVTGILLFYPIPFMRLPIGIAKCLGNTTAKYRWFSIFYLVFMFMLLPLFIFSLSLAGSVVLMSVGTPILVLIVVVIIINIIQRKLPSVLPAFLRNWNWLPKFMRSLEPYDQAVSAVCGVCKCCICLQNRRDSKFLGLPPNQSEINILDSRHSSVINIDSKNMNGIDNNAFGWKKSNNTKL